MRTRTDIDVAGPTVAGRDRARFWAKSAGSLCFGLILVVVTIPLISWLAEARVRAEHFDAAPACPASVVDTSRCVLTTAATVQGARKHGGPTGMGMSDLHTSFSVSAPGLPSGWANVSVDGDQVAALPDGTPAQVVAWNGAVVRFTVLGKTHTPDSSPAKRFGQARASVAAGLWFGIVSCRGMVLLYIGKTRWRGPQRVLDGTLVVLAAAANLLIHRSSTDTGGSAIAVAWIAGITVALLIVSGIASLPTMVRAQVEDDQDESRKKSS